MAFLILSPNPGWTQTLQDTPTAAAVSNGRALELRFVELSRIFSSKAFPILQSKCISCHSTDKHEGELDLEQYQDPSKARQAIAVWQKVSEMVETEEMPPKDALQLGSSDRSALLDWIHSLENFEADATAGDPGPVMLRRLNNIEYTYSIQQLTGLELFPAEQFPADSAAGEGFTNTGNALVMSPALLDKYLDAAKKIAEHVVLLPREIQFSEMTTARDRADDVVKRIRQLYARYTDESGGTRVHLQGLAWDTNQGGRVPVEKYFQALLNNRDALAARETTIAKIAHELELSPKYLQILHDALSAKNSSVLMQELKKRYDNASTNNPLELAKWVASWQNALHRFQSVGHMKPWIVPVSPLVTTAELKLKLSPKDLTQSTDIEFQFVGLLPEELGPDVILHAPSWKGPGRVPLAHRDLELVTKRAKDLRTQSTEQIDRILKAVDQVLTGPSNPDLKRIAKDAQISDAVFRAWLDYLNIAPTGSAKIDNLFQEKIESLANYEFVSGWGSPKTPSVAANASNQHVRIPGNLKPYGVVAHPAPEQAVVVAWKAPKDLVVDVSGAIQHAHPECGNGVTWALEIRRGARRQRIATGNAQGPKQIELPIQQGISIRSGEMIVVVIGPRNGNHSCDLTDVDLEIRQASSSQQDEIKWNLRNDVASNLLQDNPHPDQHGNLAVWHFGSESITSQQEATPVIPVGSLLARWLAAPDSESKIQLAAKLGKLLLASEHENKVDLSALPEADKHLLEQLTAYDGPLLGLAIDRLAQEIAETADKNGESRDLRSTAARTLRLAAPRELLAGRELVAQVTIADGRSSRGAIQPVVGLINAESTKAIEPLIDPSQPILVAANTAMSQDLEKAFDEFRRLFPAAMCYMKIVPVDEVVTLALYHREDQNLQRLMLSQDEQLSLDALWQELHFVSRDPLTVQDAYDQLMQYATQDSDPKLFEHLREPIAQRALEFKKELLDAEPIQLNATLRFAERAFRRPMTELESQSLTQLYHRLRNEGLAHEDSIKLLVAKVLVSPAFLYRIEARPVGDTAGPVDSFDLASRLSYFYWSSPPDEELLTLARKGQLTQPTELLKQSRRMQKDGRIRRMAQEFANQWLQIQDIHNLDEKSEKHFPEFKQIRVLLQEEATRFFTHLFEQDRSVLEIIDADYTFLNESLANFYEIDGVEGEHWRRVDGVKNHSRGGVLGFGATLAKQSGASRTSPILRGNWISEVLLGERLPRPPKDVPALPSDEIDQSATVRELVELHSQDERCAKCHRRIDPFGFALEQFDAIGRFRKVDLAGHPVSTKTHLPNGRQVHDAIELREALLANYRDKFLEQFCRKLLGYALGRSVRLSDQQLISQMKQNLKANDYRVSAALETIVSSQQFTWIRGHSSSVESENH